MHMSLLVHRTLTGQLDSTHVQGTRKRRVRGARAAMSPSQCSARTSQQERRVESRPVSTVIDVAAEA
jgi:hypothetical protein